MGLFGRNKIEKAPPAEVPKAPEEAAVGQKAPPSAAAAASAATSAASAATSAAAAATSAAAAAKAASRAAEDTTVFEFGSTRATSSKSTLAGFCPVSDELEACRWEIIQAHGSEAPLFRIIF